MASPSPAPSQSNPHGNDPLTATVRSLVFNATVPIRVEIHRGDLPATANRTIEFYYVSQLGESAKEHGALISLERSRRQLQAPRIAYLALLLADIRTHFVELVLAGAVASANLQDSDLWFETEDGTPLRWCARLPSARIGWRTS